MQLTPGVVALVQLLPRLLSPPTALYISFQIYKAVLGEPVSQWLRFPVYMLVLLATFAARVLYAQIKTRRDHKRPLARWGRQAVDPRVECQKWVARQVHFSFRRPSFDPKRIDSYV